MHSGGKTIGSSSDLSSVICRWGFTLFGVKVAGLVGGDQIFKTDWYPVEFIPVVHKQYNSENDKAVKRNIHY